MERLGKMPTWNEFARFYFADEAGKSMLGDTRCKRHEKLVSEGIEDDVALDALDWRIGLAYYGIVRDVFTVVQLRDRGIDVRCHPLADTLFRTDAWVGSTIISLRVKNPVYRDSTGGRKMPPQELFADAYPPFRYEDVELDAAEDYGVVHLPTDQAIDRLVDKISQQNSDFQA